MWNTYGWLNIIIGYKVIYFVLPCCYTSFTNFNTINNSILWFTWGLEMVQLTGESSNVATHSLKHVLSTHIIFTERYTSFGMALMWGLLLLANQGMSRRQYNSKCGANKRCYLTVQEQTSRVRAPIYHIHGLHAMPWMQQGSQPAIS